MLEYIKTLHKHHIENCNDWDKYVNQTLTLKHQEMHGCIVTTVAADALVLMHQAITIHNAD